MKSPRNKPQKQRGKKVAVVTGAGVRLGKAIALALHREGYMVIVHYHASRAGASRVVGAMIKEGGAGIFIRADIRKPVQVKRLFASVQRKYGRLDLLVNNAATFRRATVRSTSEQRWDEALDTNLKGTFFCAQAASRVMKGRNGGVIINIASLGGLQAWSQHLPYSVSKAGVIMLTKILAKSLAPKITVNAIAPGTILMPGEETGVPHIPKRLIPLRRHGTTTDITDLVIYLATRSRNITGQIFAVDGGRSIH